MMKRIFYLAVSVLSSLLVLGCTETSSLGDNSPFLNFNEGQKFSIVLPSTSASGTIEFTTNNSWIATSSEDWLTVSPAQGGSGKNTVTISASPNQDTGKREAEIVILVEGLSQTINVRQSGCGLIDSSFAKCLQERGYISDADYISYDEVKNITKLDVSESNLTSLKGIEYFISLRSLNCSSNKLTSLDLSNNNHLSELDCSSNELTSLNLKGRLEKLDCSFNKLSSLGDGFSDSGFYLDCSYNQLTSLRLADISCLHYLDCSNNQLASLDIQNYAKIELEYFNCSHNRLASLDLRELGRYGSFEVLRELNCSNNQLTSLGFDGLWSIKIEELNCSNNLLTSLELECYGDGRVGILNCSNNQLTSLFGEYLPYGLVELNCSNNQLTSLFGEYPPYGLVELNCSNNLLTSINPNCNDMKTMTLSGNPGNSGQFIVVANFSYTDDVHEFTYDHGWVYGDETVTVEIEIKVDYPFERPDGPLVP